MDSRFHGNDNALDSCFRRNDNTGREDNEGELQTPTLPLKLWRYAVGRLGMTMQKEMRHAACVIPAEAGIHYHCKWIPPSACWQSRLKAQK